MDRPHSYPISIVNNLLHDIYCRVFEDIAEDAPWLPMVTAMQRPFADLAHMSACFREAIQSASKLDQMALVKTYGQVFEAQLKSNQDLSEDLRDALLLKKDLYVQKFNFPYVLPPISITPEEVLSDMLERLEHEEYQELRLALTHIGDNCCQKLNMRIEQEL